MIHTSLRLLFSFAQTFFIFKNYKLAMNFRKGFVRFGLLHMIATNLCVWAETVVKEGAESYAHYHAMTVKMHQTHNKQYKPDELLVASTPQPGVAYTNHGNSNSVNKTLGICHTEKTLADQAALYLYPCAIQFCLIGVAALFRMFKNIGVVGPVRLFIRKSSKRIGGICHKSNTGLFAGLVVVALVCISACFFLLYDPNKDPFTNKVTILVYLGADSVVTTVAFLAVLLGFCRIYKLDKDRHGGSILDQAILLGALGGYFLLVTFIVIPTLNLSSLKDSYGILSIAQVTLYVLAILQALTQVTFIMDGLRRCTTSRQQLKTKPGRSIITFLILTNLAMWLVNTFQLKEIHSSITLRMYYGDLAWQIIMHLCFPLTIFFRFYSSVTLAEIWMNAYKRKRQNSQVYKGKNEQDRLI